MAVQKSRKTPSKRGMRRSHNALKNPALAEDPTIAAKIAVWFWKHRVQPKVDNWNDVRDVTKPINPGLNGLEDREENFKDYLAAMVSPTDKTSAKV